MERKRREENAEEEEELIVASALKFATTLSKISARSIPTLPGTSSAAEQPYIIRPPESTSSNVQIWHGEGLSAFHPPIPSVNQIFSCPATASANNNVPDLETTTSSFVKEKLSMNMNMQNISSSLGLQDPQKQMSAFEEYFGHDSRMAMEQFSIIEQNDKLPIQPFPVRSATELEPEESNN